MKDTLLPLLSDIIDTVADPIFVKDEEHRFLLMNEAMCRFMGHPRDSMLGKSDFDFFPEEEAQVFWAKDDEVFRSGETVENEERLTGADGQTFIISTKKSIFINDKGEKILVGVIRDLTRLKQTEQELREARDVAQKASAAKTRFLANASHELRTPLNGIVGIVELLQDRPWEGEIKELLDVLRDSADNLLTLVNDLLDFSAIDTGKVSLKQHRFAPRKLLKSIATLFEHQVSRKGLRLDFEISPLLPEDLMGDENRLRQVLVNLVSNAVKFTPEGGRVLVEVEPQSNLEGVRFSVRDDGIGIPEDQLDKVLLPFAKARERDQGTGLGLAICRQLLTLMGGTLTLQSEAGCTVTVELPLRQGPAPPDDSMAPKPEAQRFPGLRVLVVEDDPVSQKVAALSLRKLSCQATVVGNGLEALERFDSDSFDLILMDCRMPVMDGYETARRIRDKEGAGSRVPIFALTAHAFQEDREKCLAAGMDHWLTKQLQRKQLVEAISSHCPARATSD